MESDRTILIPGREEAGRRLGRRLGGYRNSKAVVVGIPHGGVCIASAVADVLNLPLEVIPCIKIKHPTNRSVNIGSVSVNEACLHDCPYDVPQDYIYHQMAFIRNTIESENNFYHSDVPPIPLRHKTVILVDDIVISSDTIIASLRTIKKENPLKVIVAVAVVSVETARMIRAVADDLVFLLIEKNIDAGKRYFLNFPKIDDVKVRDLLIKSKERFAVE